MVLPNGAVSVGLPGCLDQGLALLAWLFGLDFEMPQLCEWLVLEHRGTSGASEGFSDELYGTFPLDWSVGAHKIARRDFSVAGEPKIQPWNLSLLGFQVHSNSM